MCIRDRIGGLVPSQWALHQCFNGSQLCNVMHGHLLGVVPPTVATILLAWLTWRAPEASSLLNRLAISAISLVVLQIILGIATFKLHLQVEPLTVTHQIIGASLLGTLVAFTVLATKVTKSTAIKN